jgi:hypothetical protein
VNVAIDLVGELDHRRLDHPLGNLADIEGEFLRGELKVHALELVHGEGELAFLHVLCGGNAPSRTVKSVGRLIEIVSPFSKPLTLLRKLVLIAAIDEAAHHASVFEDHHRFLGDDVRGQDAICHLNLHQAGARMRAGKARHHGGLRLAQRFASLR